MNTQAKGNVALLKAVMWFQESGYCVFVPIGHSGHVDMIAARPDEKPRRVQCKWTGKLSTSSRNKTNSGGYYAVDFRSSPKRKVNRKWGIEMKYTAASFDLLFVSCPSGNYLFPWTSERAKHSSLNLGPGAIKYKL